MRGGESNLQVTCVDWFRVAYPQYRSMLFSIPNGGHRNLLTAMKMKREGVIRGVPDLFLSLSRNDYHGFYIEMKYGKNKLSKDQENFFFEARKHGYRCEVIYSLDQFIREIHFYINPNNL